MTEVKAILGDVIELRSQALDLVEIQGRTMEEISADKCRRAAEAVSSFHSLLFNHEQGT